MSAALALLDRDIRIAFRAGGGGLFGAVFFALVAVLFAFAVGADRALLARLAAPILWTAALLATLVTLDRLFQADAEDGALDVMVETSDSLALAVAAKAAAHWLTTTAPLLVAAPVLALLLNLPRDGYAPLLLSLAIGTPGLSLIGTLAAALTLSLKRAGVLAALLATPLFAPILIFGVAAADSGADGAARTGAALLLLSAATFFAAALAPLAGAAALRAHLD